MSRSKLRIAHVSDQCSDTKDAQYQCPQCRKRFTRSDLLRKHRKIHTRLAHVSSGQHISTNTEDHDLSSGAAVSDADVHADSTTPISLESSDAPINPETNGSVQSTQVISQVPTQLTMTGSQALNGISWNTGGPGYGEGLFDVDLEWTFAYILNDVGEPYSFTQPDNVACSLDSGLGPGTSILPQVEHTDVPRSTNADHTDWPDRESRSTSPSRGQTIPLFSQSQFVDASEVNHTRQRYSVTLNKCASISSETSNRIFGLVAARNLSDFCGRGPNLDEFPDTPILQHFLLLYFVHVHHRFPVIHLPTFSPDQCSLSLLLSMMLAGSCHSPSNQGNFCHAFMERARMVATLQREKDSNHVSLQILLEYGVLTCDQLKKTEHILTLFLLSMTATWSGHTKAYQSAETDRGVLVSACRRSHLLDCLRGRRHDRKLTAIYGQEKLYQSWLGWIEMERRKRLGISIYILDCQFAALLQRQPYISKAETINTALPCGSTYWEAATAQTWKLHLGPAEIPPSVYYLPTLTSILLGKELPDMMVFPSIDSFSRLFYVYVVHTHIFEWRQAVCMLNSTGLKDIPVSFAPEHLGEGLLDRQRWLVGALNTWLEAYGSVDALNGGVTAQDTGGRLLYHLGHLALSISFSDLHVMVGRSGLQEDISIAAESLRNRLMADQSCNILSHAFQMLDLAFNMVERGQAQQCSFEVAICLFMGGLICWAVHHMSQAPELTGYLVWLQQHRPPGDQDRHSASPNTTNNEQSPLMQKVQNTIVALRSLPFIGFASIFASVLEKLCNASQ